MTRAARLFTFHRPQFPVRQRLGEKLYLRVALDIVDPSRVLLTLAMHCTRN